MADRPEVTAAVDALHAAHRAAAESTIDSAHRIAETRRALAEVLREDERPALGAMPVPRLEQADIRQIGAAADELGLDRAPNTAWTPQQWLQLLRALPDTLAGVLIERWLHDAGEAWRCFEMHHEGQIEELRIQLQAGRVAHQCWDHAHPEEATLRG